MSQQMDFIRKYISYVKSKMYSRVPNIWVFGEWFGKKTGDNVTSYVNYLAENYTNLDLYWLCNRDCDTSALDKRVTVLDFQTEKSIEISRKAAVAVMNEGISDLSYNITNYWGNAVKVNLWHGIPWKKIGYDVKKPKQSFIVGTMQKNMYKYDLYETPSDEYTSHIKTAFLAEDKSFIRAGQPRNSIFFDEFRVMDSKRKVFDQLGLSDTDKVLAYLPTFRDSHSKPFSFTEVKDQSFHVWLRANNIYIVQKAHTAETSSFGGSSDHIINRNDFSAQELMAASDMLITDYSSCFFDYLLLDRPIIHYLYDYSFYKNQDRGLYYSKDDVVCGPSPATENELIKEIQDNFDKPALYHRLREERKLKFMAFESPNSCRIITERIFEELKKRGLSLD